MDEPVEMKKVIDLTVLCPVLADPTSTQHGSCCTVLIEPVVMKLEPIDAFGAKGGVFELEIKTVHGILEALRMVAQQANPVNVTVRKGKLHIDPSSIAI